MKYDDASWHYEGDFPEDLPESAGATHAGMFLAWSLLNGLGNESFMADIPEDLTRLKERKITPGAFLAEVCDEKLVDEELSDEGNAFAAAYYDGSSDFAVDYEATVTTGLPTIYHAEDSWANYDLLKPVFDRRYREWKDKPASPPAPEPPAKKPWWKPW
jgi:hypothetical protein